MPSTEAKKAYMRKYNAEHREELRAYYRNYNAEHREEVNAYQRKWLAGRPGYGAAKQREYRNTDAGYAMLRAGYNALTAKRRGAVLDPELTNAVLAGIFRDHNECAWCGNRVPLRERMIDHRIAIYFGGAHTAPNIQILCKPCEKQKTSAENSLRMQLRNGATQSDFVLVV